MKYALIQVVDHDIHIDFYARMCDAKNALYENYLESLRCFRVKESEISAKHTWSWVDTSGGHKYCSRVAHV